MKKSVTINKNGIFNDSLFNVINCKCEMKKLAALVKEKEQCEEIIDDINYIIQNKTITLIKKIEN